MSQTAHDRMDRYDMVQRLKPLRKDLLIEFIADLIEGSDLHINVVENTISSLEFKSSTLTYNDYVSKYDALIEEYYKLSPKLRMQKKGKEIHGNILFYQKRILKHPLYKKTQSQNTETNPTS